MRPSDFTPSAQPPGAGRYHALDGIRGWAALSVVAFHMVWETFGARFPEFRNVASASLLDGWLAVSVFFVLSGEALSTGCLVKQDSRIALDLGVRRYPRLVIPILAVCLMVYAAQKLGLVCNRQAGLIVGRPDWMADWLSFPPSLSETLKFALFGVFKDASTPASLDPFLWTMKMELLGSVAILGFLALAVRTPRAWVAAPVLTLLLLAAPGGGAQLACFFAGAFIARLRQQGMFQRLNASAGVNLFALGFLFAIMAADAFLHTKGWFLWRYPAVAILMMLAIFSSASAMRAMESRLSQFLGRVSFPLFLVQFPVIVTFTSWAIIALQGRQALSLASAAGIALLSIGLSLALATAFQPVESFAKHAARILSRAVLRPRSPTLAIGAPDPGLAP